MQTKKLLEQIRSFGTKLEANMKIVHDKFMSKWNTNPTLRKIVGVIEKAAIAYAVIKGLKAIYMRLISMRR